MKRQKTGIKRDEYTEAQQLQGLFLQLDQAEEELAQCRELTSEMGEKEQLAGQIQAAWEVKASSDQLEEKKPGGRENRGFIKRTAKSASGAYENTKGGREGRRKSGEGTASGSEGVQPHI